jgi:UDP-N-acetylmuramate dehydrogenase
MLWSNSPQDGLVLVNYGKANGNQVKKLAEIIQREVKKIFDIAIEAEVNIF